LDNYSDLLDHDTRFVYAVIRTVLISAICLGLEFTFGLGLAVLFQRGSRASPFCSRPSSPHDDPAGGGGYIFWMLFQSNGPVNQVLELGLRGRAAVDWSATRPSPSWR
jgi:multiple sugar transport system permease protein